MRIPGDVIILHAGVERWILFNVFTHAVLGVDTEGLRAFAVLGGGGEVARAALHVWDIEHFANYDGLFADPTRFRAGVEWGAPRAVAADQYRELLKQKTMLVESEAAYAASLGLKTSVLDRSHHGNFHQQLGQHLLLERREDPEQWWLKQKFTADLRGLGNNLYHAVQEPFVQQLIARRFLEGVRVLDLGCGVGYYTRQFGSKGAVVTGVDPNAGYVAAAQVGAPANVTFTVSRVGAVGDLDWLPAASFDYVFMSDVLLFYFVSPGTAPAGDIGELCSSIRRVLKPTGRFFSLEPHGVFFLRPWLGDAARPFTVITEHRHARFNVAPTMADACAAFVRGGFCVLDYQELYVERPVADPRAGAFASQYPLWSFYELGLRPA